MAVMKRGVLSCQHSRVGSLFLYGEATVVDYCEVRSPVEFLFEDTRQNTNLGWGARILNFHFSFHFCIVISYT